MARKLINVAATSPGRVIDPFLVEQAAAVAGGATDTLFSAFGLRGRLRRLRSQWQSGKAFKRAEKLADYSDEGAIDAAEDLLMNVHDAFGKGNLASLRRASTEQFFTALKRGLDLRAGGAQRAGAEIVGFPEASKIVQGRLAFNVPEAMRGWRHDPDFLQVTVRTVSEQVPVERPAAGAGARSGGGKGKTQPVADSQLRGGEWRAALADNGQLYYWHTMSGQTTWRRPEQYGVVGLVPADPLTAGAVRQLLEHPDEQGRPVVRVVNYCVLERAFDKGAEWRLCAL